MIQITKKPYKNGNEDEIRCINLGWEYKETPTRTWGRWVTTVPAVDVENRTQLFQLALQTVKKHAFMSLDHSGLLANFPPGELQFEEVE